MNKIKKQIRRVALKACRTIAPFIKNDERYIKLYYLCGMFRFLDLKHPKRFNEKLQWLKINNRNESFTSMVDKQDMKLYVASKIGNGFTIPTLGVWNSFDEIDFSRLPDSFVLKTTHDQAGVVIVKDKASLNIDETRRFFTNRLLRRTFMLTREYPYKNVKPRIIAEQFMVDESGTELKDYKIFCFNGEPRMALVVWGRNTDMRKVFVDTSFNLMPIQRISSKMKSLDAIPEKPQNFEEMLSLARELSKGIPYLRVDFYNINGKNYIGELTFFPASGISPFEPDEWDYKLGEWLELPKT